MIDRFYDFNPGRTPSTPDEKGKYTARYSLAADAIPAEPTPVVIGVPWYRSAYKPEVDADGIAWLKTVSGGLVGGHCLCLKPPALADPKGAHAFFDQGVEGSCVGWGWSRAGALVEGRLFSGFPLYERARQVDEWEGEDYSGTSVQAGGRVAKDEGLWLARGGRVSKNPGERWRMGSYWWAQDVETVFAVLKQDINLGYATYLQSWGESHPHETRITVELLDRLIFREEGDAAAAVNLPKRPGLAA